MQYRTLLKFPFAILTLIQLYCSLQTYAMPHKMWSGIVTDHSQPYISLKILHGNGPGRYILNIYQFGEIMATAERQSTNIKLRISGDSDNVKDSLLIFENGQEEELLNSILEPYKDVFTSTDTNFQSFHFNSEKSESTDFINTIFKYYRSDGVLLCKAATPQQPATTSLWILGLVGLAIVIVIYECIRFWQKRRSNNIVEQVEVGIDEHEKKKIELAKTPQKITNSKDKKKQDILNALREELKQANKEKSVIEHQFDQFKIDQSRLIEQIEKLTQQLNREKETNNNLTTETRKTEELIEQNNRLQSDNVQYKDNEKALTRYFEKAAEALTIPFADLDTTGLNPTDPASMNKLIELIIMQAIHFFSLTRKYTNRLDNDDVYNLKKFGIVVPDEINQPEPIKVGAQSGYPILLLSIAALLQYCNSSATDMDVNIRGFSFKENMSI